MSLKELQEDFSKVIKPQLEEILRLLKNHENSLKDNIEAAAAKVITEIRNSLKECHCNKEILDAIQTSNDNQIIVKDNVPFSGKYSYPNFSVGNSTLGTGENPGSLTWPFGDGKKKDSS